MCYSMCSLLTPGKSQPSNPQNVIVYLPSGPLFEPPRKEAKAITKNDQHDPVTQLTPQQTLASATSSTVVTVKYRLGKERADGKQKTYKYPIPVHDALTGLDWITENLNPFQMCVYGSHIGGSLAAMLALTEPRSFTAVAADKPVCDWVGLDDYCMTKADYESHINTSQASSNSPSLPDPETATSTIDPDALNAQRRGRRKGQLKPAPPDLVPLLEARRKLFSRPHNYYDTFASPILFLRSTGKYCPLTFPTYMTGPEYPIPVLRREPRTEADQLYLRQWLRPDGDIDMLPEETEPANSLIKPARRRKALSRWPPHTLNYSPGPRKPQDFQQTTLPKMRVYVRSNVSESSSKSVSPEDGDGTLKADGPGVSEMFDALTLQNQHDHGADEYDVDDLPGESGSKSSRLALGKVGKIRRETVLANQGAELVSLMHIACFWGHAKGFGEERVKLIQFPYHAPRSGSGDGGSGDQRDVSAAVENGDVEDDLIAEKDAAKWFSDIFRADANTVN